MTKPKATDYTSSLVLADYYLDLGLDIISDQIRHRAKPPLDNWSGSRFKSVSGSWSWSRSVSRSRSRSWSWSRSVSRSRSMRRSRSWSRSVSISR